MKSLKKITDSHTTYVFYSYYRVPMHFDDDISALRAEELSNKINDYVENASKTIKQLYVDDMICLFSQVNIMPKCSLTYTVTHPFERNYSDVVESFWSLSSPSSKFMVSLRTGHAVNPIDLSVAIYPIVKLKLKVKIYKTDYIRLKLKSPKLYNRLNQNITTEELSSILT